MGPTGRAHRSAQRARPDFRFRVIRKIIRQGNLRGIHPTYASLP